MIKISDLSKVYKLKKEHITALNDINIELCNKGLIFILGESGSGKTTLINLISGLDSVTSGKICVNEKDITAYNEQELDRYRNKYVGLIFQNFNLLEDKTVYENISLPLEIAGYDRETIKSKIENVLNYVELSGYEERNITELSAGQKQRIAIARAVVKNPDILLADELTGNLDEKNADNIFKLLYEIGKERLVIVVSHDKTAAEKYADRIITLDRGNIISDVDNTLLKIISNESTVLIDDKSYPISEFDIVKEIGKKELDLSQNNKVELNLTIHIDKKEEQICNKEKNDEPEFKATHISVKNILQDVFKSMKTNKMRCVIITFLMMVVIVSSYLLIAIYINDYELSMYKYINGKGLTEAVVYKEVGDEDNTQEIYRGKVVYEELNRILGENLIKVKREQQIAYIDKYGRHIFETADIIILDDNSKFHKYSIFGRYPNNANEFAVDRKTAEILNIGNEKINSNMTVGEQEMMLTGIVEFESENANFMFLDESYIDYYIENNDYLNFEGNHLINSIAVSTFTSTSVKMGYVDVLKDTDTLVYGRMPKSENEILISLELVENMGFEIDKKFPTEYRLHNLRSEQYKGKYDDIINMYDYMGKNIVISGIYDSDIDYEILIDNDVYNKVKNEYYKYYFFDKYYVDFDSEKTYDYLKQLHDEDYKIETPLSNIIYFFVNLGEEFSFELKGLIVLMGLVMLTLMIYHILNMVKDNRYKIGIYRSIGVERRDIFMTFLIENVICCLISIILAMFVTGVLVKELNDKISSMFLMNNISIFMLRVDSIAIYSCVVLFLLILISIIPLERMMRKKIILLINRQ